MYTHRDVVPGGQANLDDTSGLLCRQNRRSQRVCVSRYSSVESRTTHPLFKREQFIPVPPCTHTFATPDTGPTELPPQVFPDDLVMNNDGYVFAGKMSWQEIQRNQTSRILTGSFYTKHEPVTELGDGTPMFTFTVKKTQSSVTVGVMSNVGAEVKMEPKVAGGPCVLPTSKNKHSTTLGSAASAKTTSSKLRKATGGGIVKDLDFSGQWTTIVVPPRVRAFKLIRTVRRTVSWLVFHRVEYQPVITDSCPSHLFYMSVLKSESVTLQTSVTH